MNRGEGFKAMNARDIVLPKRDLDYKVKLVSNDDWLKKVWIFLVLSARENPHKAQLTSPSFSNPLCSLFSWALLISFLRCSSLDICLFTYAFSCSLSRFSRRILPTLAPFLLLYAFLSTGFTPFTSCFLWSLCLFLSSLLSLKTLFPRTWIITVSPGWQSFSTM